MSYSLASAERMGAPYFPSTLPRAVIRDCLAVKEHDIVLIDTWHHTLDFAYRLAEEVCKEGADVLLSLKSDAVYYWRLERVPEPLLRRPSNAWLGMADIITAAVWIQGPEDPSKEASIGAERFAAAAEAEVAVNRRLRERKVRSASILLGMYSQQRAGLYGFSLTGWFRSFRSATSVDFRKLADAGRRVRRVLEGRRLIHISSPSGTSLNLEATGRPVHLFDGVTDQEDIKRGMFLATIPSGCVGLAPVETSANGVVGFDRPMWRRYGMADGVKWRFKNGRVVTFEGSKNFEALKKEWEQSGGDKDRISSLYVGINPKAELGFLDDYLAAGMVTIGIGQDRSLGGVNKTEYFLAGSLSKATLEADGITIVKEGVLQV